MLPQFTITSEPAGIVFRALLEIAGKFSTLGLVVVRPGEELEPTAVRLLSELKSFGDFPVELLSEWPGTKLLEGIARVQKFRIDPTVFRLLQTTAESLCDWQHPRLPEDLCLMRNDSSPILVTIAHGRDAYLVLSEEEAAEIQRHIPELRLKRDQIVVAD